MFKWLKNLLRLSKRDTVKLYDGCTLCYGSGVVSFPIGGNRHFRGEYIYRRCHNGCELTPYGAQRLTK